MRSATVPRYEYFSGFTDKGSINRREVCNAGYFFINQVFRLFVYATLANDIAIAFTDLPFIINEYVRPAALPNWELPALFPTRKSFEISVRPFAKTMVSG